MAMGHRHSGNTRHTGHIVVGTGSSETRNAGCKRVIRNILVGVYGRGMLAQVVEARKAAATMALVGAFASVFTDVTDQMFTAGEAEVAVVIAGAGEAVGFLLGLFGHTAAGNLFFVGVVG